MNYRAPRWPAENATRVFGPSGEEVVKLRNVGPEGLGIYCCSKLATGQEIRVIVAGQILQARVRWTQGPAAGVELSRRLTQEQMAFIRGIALGGSPGGRPLQGRGWATNKLTEP